MNIRIEARSLVAVVSAAFAVSALTVACAAPTEGDEVGAAEEHTDKASEALIKGGGGGGGGSTCDSRLQNCYITCGALYGLKDPKTEQQCQNLCDEIAAECKNRPVFGGGSSGVLAP